MASVWTALFLCPHFGRLSSVFILERCRMIPVSGCFTSRCARTIVVMLVVVSEVRRNRQGPYAWRLFGADE